MFTGMPEGRAISDPGASAAACGRRASAALEATRFSDVRWVAATGSTNADALELARQGAPEGVVVVADHQSAGRGRRDRRWVAPPGGSLLVSVLLRPPAPWASTASLAAAVAMVEAVADVSGVTAGIKWPNDLMVETPAGERKLAGLLAEADWPAGSTVSAGYREPAAHDRAVVVVGVGVNVSWPPAPDAAGTGDAGEPELAEVAGLATALNWLGAEVDRVDLLVAFLRRLDAHYATLLADGPADLVAAWRARSATLGRRVRVNVGNDVVEGTAVDVTDAGHLVVDTDEGERRVLAVGDVVHLRPA